MSEESYYPGLTSGAVGMIRIALDQLTLDPLWLERAECPYDGGTIEAIQAVWRKVRKGPASGGGPDAGESESQSGAGDWEDVAAEAWEVFKDVRDMREGLTSEDGTARVAYYKMAAATMEKLVQLGERAQNIKRVSDFQRRVLDVFEEVLSPEERTRVTEMLAQ